MLARVPFDRSRSGPVLLAGDRHLLRAAIVILAVVLPGATVGQSATSDLDAVEPRAHAVFDLFHFDDAPHPPQLGNSRPSRALRHWVLLEMDGAGLQARDWLRAAGLSFLKQRDSEGRHSYEVTSGALASDGPKIQLHARLGYPELSAGLHPRREIPAVGLTIPGETCTFDFEGLRDRNLGTALMARLRWNTPDRRVEWGIAAPVAVSMRSIGILLQVRIKLEE